jgi:glycosyltransferase involved in cell wall biosynthesis
VKWNGRQIAVLLATYNGSKYLAAQLESLFRQTCKDFHLYVRDDGSTDDTLKIVDDFVRMYPDRITVVRECVSHCGAARSFIRLLRAVNADYYMFCDQDDIWHEDKIEKTFACMRKVEEEVGNGVPVVVSTDLRVVDENLAVMKESFNANLKIDVFRKHPQMLCVRHVVTGCTMMFNADAKAVSFPMSSLSTMHDEWVALCTQFNEGKVFVMDEVTVDYRQHSSNTLGAATAGRGFFKRALAREGWKQFFQSVRLLHREFGVSFPRFLLYKILYSWM